jgi:hypothetical protein
VTPTTRSTRAAGGPLADELAARRAAQHDRAERARLGAYDREHGNTCSECGPANPATAELGGHRGWVPATVDIPPQVEGNLDRFTRVVWRPCFSCNRARWQAWQRDELSLPAQTTRRADPAAGDRADRARLR